MLYVVDDSPTLALERKELLLDRSLRVAASTLAVNPLGRRVNQTHVHGDEHSDRDASVELSHARGEQRQGHHDGELDRRDYQEGEPRSPAPRAVGVPEPAVGVPA